MKKTILAISTIISTFAFAQQRPNSNSNIWLSLIMPKLSVEVGLTESISLSAGIGQFWVGEYENVNGVVTKNTIEGITTLSLLPKIRTTIAKRREFGKTTDNFSGGYVALPVIQYLSKGYGLELVYGTQGTWGKTGLFFYNINAGLGYSKVDLEENPDVDGIGLTGSINIGFRLK